MFDFYRLIATNSQTRNYDVLFDAFFIPDSPVFELPTPLSKSRMRYGRKFSDTHKLSRLHSDDHTTSTVYATKLGSGGCGDILDGKVEGPAGKLRTAVKVSRSDSPGRELEINQKLSESYSSKDHLLVGQVRDGVMSMPLMDMSLADIHHAIHAPRKTITQEQKLLLTLLTARDGLVGLLAFYEKSSSDTLLIHRDVKPGNILIRINDGMIKLADFGLAEPAGTKANSGTIGYYHPIG